MANKRQLKRYIRDVSGTMAMEIIMAREAFPEIDRKTVHDLVLKIARFQSEYLRAVGILYDRTPRDFENRHEYNKAKRVYFHTAFKHFEEKFLVDYAALVKEMNAALPDEVRQRIKEVIG